MNHGFNITDYFGEVFGNPAKEAELEREFDRILRSKGELLTLMFPGGQTQAQELSKLLTEDPFKDNPTAYADFFYDLCRKLYCNAAISLTFDYEMMMLMGVKTPGSGAESIDWRVANLRLIQLASNFRPLAETVLVRLGNELYMSELLVGTKFRMGGSYDPRNVFQRLANLLNRDRKSAKQLYAEAAQLYVEVCKQYIPEIRRKLPRAKIAAVVAEEENQAYKDWNTIVYNGLKGHVDYFNFQLYQAGTFRRPSDIENNLLMKMGSMADARIPKVMCEYWYQFGDKGLKGADPVSYQVYIENIEHIVSKYFDYAFQWRLVGDRKPGGEFNSYNKITVG